MPRYQFKCEAIHADWPAYPAGAGPAYALETLCCFPAGTHFRVLDEIDHCLLLVATEHMDRRHADDPYSERHHHVALDIPDVRAMWDDGSVDGLNSSRLEEFAAHDNISANEATRAAIERVGLSVTPEGWSALWEIVEAPDLHAQLADRVSALLKIGYHDSAVRDGAILLEMDLRKRTGTRLIGQQLVERYIEQTVAKAGVLGAFQRHLRSELRTFFMFIRNEFAHNIVSLDRGRGHAMLRRASAILEMLDLADEGVVTWQDRFVPPRPR
jgi:hypothetical protein